MEKGRYSWGCRGTATARQPASLSELGSSDKGGDEQHYPGDFQAVTVG